MQNNNNKNYSNRPESRRDSEEPLSSNRLNSHHITNESSIALDTTTVDQPGSKSKTTQHQKEKDRTKLTEDKPMTRKEKYMAYLKVMRPTIEVLFFDVALPLAIYYILRIWLSVLVALLLSGIPPLLRVIYIFWKRRKVDVLGCIFVASFIISAVLSIISGDARIALLRESSITAVVSVMFLVTLIPIRTKWLTLRPLVFILAQQVMAETPPVRWTDIEGEEQSIELMEWIWRECDFFRKYCYVLTGLWGVILMGEFVAKVVMIKSTLTVDQVVLYGNIIIIVAIVVMTIGSIIASQSMQKKITAVSEKWQKENDFTERFSRQEENHSPS